MGEFRKRQKAGLALAVLILSAGSGFAQDPGPAPTPPPRRAAGSGGFDIPETRADDAARLDALFTELAEKGRPDWERVETEITNIWSRSGSASMDLLLRRGTTAIEAEDYPAAVDHLTALTELAPDFAEGWNARATAYFLMGEFSLSIADIEHVLALNPRHYAALSGLASMMEEMGRPDVALRSLQAARAINPNRPNISDTVDRLRRSIGDTEL